MLEASKTCDFGRIYETPYTRFPMRQYQTSAPAAQQLMAGLSLPITAGSRIFTANLPSR